MQELNEHIRKWWLRITSKLAESQVELEEILQAGSSDTPGAFGSILDRSALTGYTSHYCTIYMFRLRTRTKLYYSSSLDYTAELGLKIKQVRRITNAEWDAMGVQN